MKKHNHRKSILKLGLLAIVSLVWLTLRTGRKPSRIAYPCQRAALANINIFVFALAPSLTGLRPKMLVSHVLGRRARVRTAVVTTFLLFLASASTLAVVTTPPVVNLDPVVLNLQPQMALEASGASNLFIVQNASGAQGNMDAAMSALITLMQSHGLMFFQTAAYPSGLIGRNDVIIIKVNGQSPQRGGTNTDLAKSVVKKILSHPESFAGEIVIADNGQSMGGIDMAESNAYDHSQSMADVAGMFPTYKVSAYSWYPIAAKSVNEYDNGDYTDGYVVNSTANAATGLRVSYPKFRTFYGTYISFKRGVWNQSARGYDSARLKIINLPMFKSHYEYGATACVKNYMGVGSQTLTAEHYTVGNGGMGTQMVETRLPTLNIIDCIWINANPFESGSACGPFTAYSIASYTNLIGASTDPVALEYWIAKHVAIPAAIQRGYTDYASLNPDYAPITAGLTQSYHNYLMYSMNVIRNSGRQVTMLENEMNAYIVRLSPSSSFLVVRGFDSRIYYRVWNGAGWGDWMALPGSTVDSPAAAMLGNELHVVVRGSDGYSLWHGYFTNPADPGTFSGWTLLSGATSSAPTLTSNGTVTCLAVRGLNSRIYVRCYDGSWGPWHPVPTGATCDGPAAAMLGNDLHIVVRGMDGHSLWDTIVSCDGTVVRGWSLRSGATPSKPVLACSGSDNLCLVVRGMDDAIYCRSYNGSFDFWGDWSVLPTGATVDGPGATVMGNMLCTVVRGSDGNTLWCGNTDLGTSSFIGWTLLSGATPSAPTLTS